MVNLGPEARINWIASTGISLTHDSLVIIFMVSVLEVGLDISENVQRVAIYNV